jgi:hypothetical protein
MDYEDKDELHTLAQYFEVYILPLAIIVTVISSLVLVPTLYMLIKAVRLKENNLFFILLFTLISLSLICIITVMWSYYSLIGVMASKDYITY